MSDSAIGAVAALMRVAELYDPAVAHRAALRAIVADRLLDRVDVAEADHDRATVLAAAALRDIDLVVTRPEESEQADDTARTILAANVLTRHAQLGAVAELVGAAPESSTSTQIIALADELVGCPAPGWTPSWSSRLDRLHRAALEIEAKVLDAVSLAGLGSIESPPDPTERVIGLLHEARNRAGTRAPTTSDAVAAAVDAAGHPGDLVRLFAEDARRTTQSDRALLLRLDEAGTSEVPPAEGASTPARPATDLIDDFGVLAELRAGVTVRRDTNDLPVGVRSEMLVPVVVSGSVWGVLVCRRTESTEPFDHADLGVARHVARLAGAALGRTEHWAAMERMALRDQLTGLANRFELYRVLDRIFERHPTDRLDVAVIMCDVDGLKDVNDNEGHEAGDRLLIDAAASLRGAVRAPERTTVCRMGGDEFCLVIDGGALLTAHAISDDIEALFARSAGSGPARSISCGLAFVTDEITSRSELLRAADLNQYETKRIRRAARGLPIEPAVRPAGDRRAVRDQSTNE